MESKRTETSFSLPERCVKCKEPFRSIFAMTMMAECGAIITPGPMDCRKGGEHKFYYRRDQRGRFRKAA